jgi:hypothetical protein
MQLVVSGISAECPRCKGTEFERATRVEGESDAPVLRCIACRARHPYGLLLAVVGQRALDKEARRRRL